MNENTTLEQEVKDAPETTENTEQTVAAEPTIADLHQEKPKPEKPKVVPMARLDKEIKKRKDLEAKLAEYESSDEDLDEEAGEKDEPEVKQLAQRLEQIENKEKLASMEATFTKHFNQALENSPEYKEVVNVNVIKALAFDPANANKTYKQLLEEAYGNALTGRRTIETTTPRGGAKDTTVDMKRAQTDKAYRHEVLADPELRKQYNAGLTDRVFR